MRIDTLPAEAAQQYFPTYRVPADKQEVTLKEYDLSAQALTADQRSISLATGLAVVVISFSGTLLSSDKGISSIEKALSANGGISEFILLAIVLCVSLVALRYFSLLQRSATYAARKIVVLRRLLGVDYGTVERVLPTDRIEGANEPFAIAMFPGWNSIGPLASVIVAAFAATLFTVLLSTFGQSPGSISSYVTAVGQGIPYYFPVVGLFAAIGLLLFYRAGLLESWESPRFLTGKLVAGELSVPLKERIGHSLYRMELSVYEAQRVGILLEAFFPILLFVEDKRFYRHRGNDWRAVARALVFRFRYRSRSGGSTLDQQLFRSTCLARLDGRWTRKPVEWVMAPWLRSRFGADQIIRMYLCSVRFDRGIIGLSAAAVHFFNAELHSASHWVASKAQVFFLVERLSNVSRTVPIPRIRVLLAGLLSESLIGSEDVEELHKIYRTQIANGLLIGPSTDLNFNPLAA